MDLSGYGHIVKHGESNSSLPTYEYNPTLDSAFGSVLLTLSVFGTTFNLIVVFAVRLVTKRNCSKARLASSLFIFNLSLSDTVYSMVHVFSAVTMLSGGRGHGVPDNNIAVMVLCNFTGIFFNLTMRSSLWFLTMLTLVRYAAVVFPLKVPYLITKKRIKIAALSVWTFIFILSLVPYSLNVGYHYSKPISICTWAVLNNIQSFQARVWFHVLLMVVPIVTPGMLIIALYLQIVWKVIQLKTVHYKLKSGNIAKGHVEPIYSPSAVSLVTLHEERGLTELPPPTPLESPPTVKRKSTKRLTAAISSISSSMAFLKRPLSLVELERYEKETAAIDEDLMDFAVSSLHKTAFNNRTSDKAGVVAYYINRFIVKTAGNGTFERIQSHSFTDSKRSLDYTAEECPISLNYYDCKDVQPSAGSSSWSLRRFSSNPSVCEDVTTGQEYKLHFFRMEQGSSCQQEPATTPPPKLDMATVVAQAMKQFLNTDINDVREMGKTPPAPPPPSLSSTSSSRSLSFIRENMPSRRISLKDVAARCRRNSIQEESVPSPPTTTSSTRSPRVVCVNGVCSEVPAPSNSSSFRIRTNPSSSFKLTTSIPETSHYTTDSDHYTTDSDQVFTPSIHPTLSKTKSLPVKFTVSNTSIETPEKFTVKRKGARLTQSDSAIPGRNTCLKVKTSSLKKKIMASLAPSCKPGILQEKRITRLDMRLNVIIQTAFYTLLMVTLFVICYMPWWLLSIDLLHRLMQQEGGREVEARRPLIDVTFTWYCNLLTISYSTILLSACCNPIIYFYFAYKQAMLETLKLRYDRFKRGKMIHKKSVVIAAKKKSAANNMNIAVSSA